MDNLESMIAEDAAQVPVTLSDIASLAFREQEIEGEILDLEAQLAEKQKEQRNIITKLLPEALTAANVDEVKLDNGYTVKKENKLEMSISDRNRAIVLSWLRDTGNEAIIKSTIVVEVPKGFDPRQKQKITGVLNKLELTYTDAETANTSSVKAIINEKLRNGEPVDVSSLGAFSWEQATIKAPKAPRAPKPTKER